MLVLHNCFITIKIYLEDIVFFCYFSFHCNPIFCCFIETNIEDFFLMTFTRQKLIWTEEKAIFTALA